MKKLTHKLALLLSLSFFFVSFQVEAKRKSTEKSKSVTEKHDISREHAILIANKFGKVDVTHWDEQAISLDVQITVRHSNENKAQEILDKIKIDIKKTDSDFKVYTRINGDKDIGLSSKKNSDLTIDYTIKLPRENQLKVDNSFGEVIMGSRSGKTEVHLKFGSATIGNLTGEDNTLKFNFSDPIIVNSMKKGTIMLKHSKLELLRSENLELRSEMSSSKIDRLEQADVILQFGSVEVNAINKLKLNSQMSSVKVDQLSEEGSIKNNYGSLSINRISKGIKELEIEAEFSPVNIQLEKTGNYKIEANIKMGDLKLPSTSIQEERPYIEEKSMVKMKKEFKGRIGEKSDKAGIIKITNSFGEIHLKLTE